MAIVSVAIMLSFHLKSKPSSVGMCLQRKVHMSSTDVVSEKKIALPLGIVFWVLSLLCLLSGLANYIETVTRYSRRQALVQTGWKTQVVFTVVSTSIVAACVLFLSTNAQRA